MAVKFQEIEKIILKDGWVHKRTNGSHFHYKHPSKKGTVTIPRHKDDLNIKTVNSILKQAGLK
jgi:predicted RNA binding protein YcfA (HicA-like mRNA interferase family)